MNLSQYVGTPFKEKGRSPDGWDCWGVPFVLYPVHLQIVLPDFLDIYEDSTDEKVAEKLRAEQKGSLFFPVEKEQAFDIVLMRMRGLPWHVGVVGDVGKMLHAERDIDTVYESYRCKKWEKRILGFYRHVSMRK